MKGYKVFNSDMTCRSFQYEVGKTYEHHGKIELCEAGFHFCPKAVDCFNYYDFNPDNIVCEVEALGRVIEGDDKHVTDKISIIRRLDWTEVLSICNSGKGNTGIGNTGHSNAGHSNTGHRNTGHRNAGDWNTGDRNTGDGNIGDRNTGDWNAGRRHSGFFCTGEAKMTLFNKPTDLTYLQVRALLPYIDVYPTCWVPDDDMTNQEKQAHPEHKTTGGYLKEIPYKEAWANWWESASDEDKGKITSLPNFDSNIFYDITGIRV